MREKAILKLSEVTDCVGRCTKGDKVYLLNTDYDMPITVKLIKGDVEKTVTLESLELKSINI